MPDSAPDDVVSRTWTREFAAPAATPSSSEVVIIGAGIVRGAATDWPGALFTPSDGRAGPHKATPALARAVARRGGNVLTGCAVRGVETTGGRVSAVVTEHGTIRTSTVLCAAGTWTSMFYRSLGIRVPQLRVRGTAARTGPAEAVCEGAMSDSNLALRRRLDGGYTVASGSIIDHPVTPSTFRHRLQRHGFGIGPGPARRSPASSPATTWAFPSASSG